MKKKLESELISIAHKILKLKGREDLDALQKEAQKLYEKLTLLKFVEDNFGEIQPTIGKSDVVKKFEELAITVMESNQSVPESNPHEDEDEIMTPGIDTIREMVEEMPEPETLDDILANFMPDPDFIKRESEIISHKTEIRETRHVETKHVETKRTSLNDHLKQHGLQIGLNDKLAFVKHLFDGRDEDYNRVISQISTFESEKETKDFINNMIKPDYNNWEGKENYVMRFFEIIESKFD